MRLNNKFRKKSRYWGGKIGDVVWGKKKAQNIVALEIIYFSEIVSISNDFIEIPKQVISNILRYQSYHLLKSIRTRSIQIILQLLVIIFNYYTSWHFLPQMMFFFSIGCSHSPTSHYPMTHTCDMVSIRGHWPQIKKNHINENIDDRNLSKYWSSIIAKIHFYKNVHGANTTMKNLLNVFLFKLWFLWLKIQIQPLYLGQNNFFFFCEMLIFPSIRNHVFN